VEDKVFQFTKWVYLNYGQMGCAVCLLIVLSVLALGYIFLSRLPEPKTVIVWSACSSCKYKCRKSSVFVLACPKHEEPGLFCFRSPSCPLQQSFDGCQIIENQSSPAIFNREYLHGTILK